MSDFVTDEVADRIATLTMDDGKANAFGIGMTTALCDALDRDGNGDGRPPSPDTGRSSTWGFSSCSIPLPLLDTGQGAMHGTVHRVEHEPRTVPDVDPAGLVLLPRPQWIPGVLGPGFQVVGDGHTR